MALNEIDPTVCQRAVLPRDVEQLRLDYEQKFQPPYRIARLYVSASAISSAASADHAETSTAVLAARRNAGIDTDIPADPRASAARPSGKSPSSRNPLRRNQKTQAVQRSLSLAPILCGAWYARQGSS
jgi:hypothetical protein